MPSTASLPVALGAPASGPQGHKSAHSSERGSTCHCRLSLRESSVLFNQQNNILSFSPLRSTEFEAVHSRPAHGQRGPIFCPSEQKKGTLYFVKEKRKCTRAGVIVCRDSFSCGSCSGSPPSPLRFLPAHSTALPARIQDSLRRRPEMALAG